MRKREGRVRKGHSRSEPVSQVEYAASDPGHHVRSHRYASASDIGELDDNQSTAAALHYRSKEGLPGSPVFII